MREVKNWKTKRNEKHNKNSGRNRRITIRFTEKGNRGNEIKKGYEVKGVGMKSILLDKL